MSDSSRKSMRLLTGLLIMLTLVYGQTSMALGAAGLDPATGWGRLSDEIQEAPGSLQLLVQAERDNPGEAATEQEAGEDNRNDKGQDKKCMTVCTLWGEECMIDNVRGTRKCRRICKEFGQECF